MNQTAQVISIARLAVALVPALVVLAILASWTKGHKTAAYGLARMLGQLLLIGYFLAYIFATEDAWVLLAVLAVMVLAASWISLRTAEHRSPLLLRHALIAIVVGGGSTLALITQGVLDLNPWFEASKMIPLAGMIFGNAMNSVSLALERFHAEVERQASYQQARDIAFRASLIPIINSLFAVGLVSLPGMMTGQILSGVSPLLAARYQIMVMCMIFGSAGISSAIFLRLQRGSPALFLTAK
jgi:UDP-glucose/iron transport system permease protein